MMVNLAQNHKILIVGLKKLEVRRPNKFQVIDYQEEFQSSQESEKSDIEDAIQYAKSDDDYDHDNFEFLDITVLLIILF